MAIDQKGQRMGWEDELPRYAELCEKSAAGEKLTRAERDEMWHEYQENLERKRERLYQLFEPNPGFNLIQTGEALRGKWDPPLGEAYGKKIVENRKKVEEALDELKECLLWLWTLDGPIYEARRDWKEKNE